jgi:hypothetical protein
VDAVLLHEARVAEGILVHVRHQRHVQLGGQRGVEAIEVAAAVRAQQEAGQAHADEQHAGAHAAGVADHLAQVLPRALEVQALQEVVAAQLDDDHVGPQAAEVAQHEAAGGRKAEDAAVQDLDGDPVLRGEALGENGRIGRRTGWQPEARRDAVADEEDARHAGHLGRQLREVAAVQADGLGRGDPRGGGHRDPARLGGRRGQGEGARHRRGGGGRLPRLRRRGRPAGGGQQAGDPRQAPETCSLSHHAQQEPRGACKVAPPARASGPPAGAVTRTPRHRREEPVAGHEVSPAAIAARPASQA